MPSRLLSSTTFLFRWKDFLENGFVICLFVGSVSSSIGSESESMMRTGPFLLLFAVVLKEVEGNVEEEAVLAAVGFGPLLTGCDSGTRRKT